MKTLIADDDLTCRLLLQGYLKSYGVIHFAENGKDAVEAVRVAFDANDPYNLICLDIMMPELNGQEVLKRIRFMEAKRGIEHHNRTKIVMTTALGDKVNVIKASQLECDRYLIKPLNKAKLLEELYNMRLIIRPEEWSAMNLKTPPDLMPPS